MPSVGKPATGPVSHLAPVRIVELELDRPIEPITGLERYAGVAALVRRRGQPVDWLELPTAGGRCSAEEIARVLEGRKLAPLPPEPRRMAGTQEHDADLPSVTVAVCTRNRSENLAPCLEALERLSYPMLDLLVVDNAPADDATERLVHSRHPRIRYARESKPGLSWARNRAIEEARSDILAFTDDDVVVDSGWVDALAAVFRHDAAVMAVTGLVVPYELETDAQVLFERYRSFARGFTPMRVQVAPVERIAARHGATGSFGTGANMAFRRRLFGEIGPFDPSLGAGTLTRGADDLEMFFRVLKAGHALVYEPQAVVRHRHRSTMAELQAQISDNGISFSAYLLRSALAHAGERWGFLRLGAWWVLKSLYRSIRPRTPPRQIMRRLAFAELGGSLIGPSRYYRARAAAAELAPEVLNPVAVEGS
jgi:GT2 family glycosyltransferase